MAGRIVSREEFNIAVDAVWSEIEYQNSLAIRTDEDEALTPPGFFTLLNVYLRKGEVAWTDNAGTEPCLPFLRKLAGIAIRGMIYCGIRYR
jgi:hypothetical protein